MVVVFQLADQVARREGKRFWGGRATPTRPCRRSFAPAFLMSDHAAPVVPSLPVLSSVLGANSAPPPWRRLLPAVLDDDRDDAAVTDALLATVDLPADLSAFVEELADLLEQATSAGTRRAYATDWTDFTGWAGRHQLLALPAEARTVALYIRRQGGKTFTHSTTSKASPASTSSAP